MRIGRSLSIFLIIVAAAAAACSAPPVDVELSVALASADQMTLQQSFALRRGSLHGLDPYVRSIRYYPSLIGSFTPVEQQPLGYFVVDGGSHVAATPVVVQELDPIRVGEGEPTIEISTAPETVEPYHVAHSVRANGGEKLVLYRYRPDPADFGARVLVVTPIDPDPVFQGVYGESLSAEVFDNDPVPAAGIYAASWTPAVPGERLAALVLSENTLDSRPFGPDPPDDFSTQPPVSEADAPSIEFEYGRVVLAENLTGFDDGTVTYANFPISGRYRTFVSFSAADPPADAQYTELGVAGRLETILASGELLTRTRDRWVISGPLGEPLGSFPAGKLQFVHERDDIDNSGNWHAVFTLTYWGSVDNEDYVFVRVYSVRSNRLRGLE